MLCQFADREGHALVPARHREDGRALGSWVSSQRRERAGMTADRRRLLEAVPGWAWRASMTWEDWMGLVEVFAGREGHARVPSLYEEQGRWLGIWVNRQRRLHYLGRLGATRERRLEAVPGWAWRIVADTPSTEEWFDILDAYVTREGHARVEADQLEAGQPLGEWVARLRNRHQQGRLPPAHEQRVEAMPGWAWRTVPPDRPWKAWYGLLEAYSAREGHAFIPRDHIENGAALGRWVASQRTLHHKGGLKEERRELLEAVPGWVWRARRVRPAPIPARSRPSSGRHNTA